MNIDNLAEYFNWRCRQQPDSLAYAFVRDSLEISESLSHAELQQQVNELAGQIAQQSQPGDRVLLVYPPGLDFVRAFWACVLSGRVAVPVPAPDAARLQQQLARLQAIIKDAQASLVLTHPELLTQIETLNDEQDSAAAKWLATPIEPGAATVAAAFTPPALAADNIAYLQYTSGSTSTPRGVIITHANALAQCRTGSKAVGIDAQSRLLCWLPHFHDYGLVFGTLVPLYRGVPSYLMSPLTFLRRPLRWLEAVARFAITHTGAPNFAYAACVKALAQQPDWHADLHSLISSSCGAEPIHPDTPARFHAAFAPHGLRPHCFAPAYGMAETVLGVTATAPGTPVPIEVLDSESLSRHEVHTSSSAAARRVVGCGVAFDETQLCIVDPQTRLPCAADRVGEIWVSGDSVGQGYWRQEQLSAEIFQARTADGQGPFLRTGDLGFLRGEQLFVCGRLKDLIIVSGRNHAPQDIEWSVQRCGPLLRAGYGAAFSIPTDDGEALVVVQEVERSAAEADLPGLVRAIRRAVAEEHDLPVHAVALIRSGTVPRTTSGKIRRQACKDGYLSGSLQILQLDRLVEQTNDSTGADDVKLDLGALADRGLRLEAIERMLIGQVAALTRRPRSDISPEASPIECGLDSLSTFRLLQGIETLLGSSLPSAEVLRAPSLRAVAELIEQRHSDPARDRHLISRRSAAQQGARWPLTATQKGMWLAERIGAGGAAYNMAGAQRLRGPLNVEALEGALRALPLRHDSLRLNIVENDGVPLQGEAAHVEWALDRLDLKHLDRSSSHSELDRALRAQAAETFALDRAPLARALLVSLCDDEHVLLLVVHHLIADGLSVAILRRDLAALYAATCAGTHVPPRDGGIGFLDFAAWEDSRIRSGTLLPHTGYWKRKLQDLQPLNLPIQRGCPGAFEARDANIEVTLPGHTVEALHALAKRAQATMFMVYLSAFKLLLGRWCGQDDIAVGTPIARREHPQMADLIGPLLNVLVLRTDLAGNPSFEALLARVRATALEAYEHQEQPFDLLVAELNPERQSGRNPLFDVMVNGMVDHTDPGWLTNLSNEAVVVPQPRAKFALTLYIDSRADSARFVLNYRADWFDADQMHLLCEQLVELLSQVARQPQQPVAKLTLSAPNLQALLPDPTQALGVAEPVSIVEEFLKQCKARPRAVAVVSPEGALSFADLEELSRNLALDLVKRDAGRGARVAVYADRGAAVVVALLGALRAGATFSILDAAYPEARNALCIEQLAPRLLLNCSASAAPVASAAIPVLHLGSSLASLHAGIASAGGELPAFDAGLPAYIGFTSGTQGRPKGIVTGHAPLPHFVGWHRDTHGLGASDRFSMLSGLSHDPLLRDIFTPLSIGATLCIPAPEVLTEPAGLVAWLERERVSVIHLTPAMGQLIAQGASKLDAIRWMFWAGEALTSATLRRLVPIAPLARHVNFYGATETPQAMAAFAITHPEADERLPIGSGIAQVQLLVLNGHGGLASPGEAGEIVIRSPYLSAGYLDDIALTVEKFIANPVTGEPSDRCYRTGDRGVYRRDGCVTYLGRIDSQVKIRGFRVEPSEIERVVEQVEGVGRAVVVVDHAGSGDPALRLYFTRLSADQDLTEIVWSRLDERLPAYMHPVGVTALDALPLLPNGKVDTRALKALAGAVAGKAQDQNAPTAIEAALMQIWKAVLGCSHVGPGDNFFRLGGHSLLATQVLARVRDAFDVELPLRTLFEVPTIAGLAAAVLRVDAGATDLAGRAAPVIERQSRETLLPTSFSQRRMWLVQQFNPQTSAYNMPFALRLRGPLDRIAWAGALERLIARHEALRTTLVSIDGEPMQHIVPSLSVPLEWLDLADQPADERLGKACSALMRRAIVPYELSKGPLHRMTLMRLSEDDHVFFWSIHHAIGDGWSSQILMRELANIYSALRRGAEPALPPKALEFADYAAWQRSALVGVKLDAQLAYWRKTLEGIQPLALPTDRIRRGETNGRGSRIAATIPPRTLTRMKALAVQHGVTPYMALLACFQLQLARFCGVNDVAVGTPIANRTLLASEQLVGTLVNTLVMRTDLAGQPRFTELMQRVRETALQAYAHQDLPFEALVEALAVSRSDGTAPLVQVLFNVHNPPVAGAGIADLDYELFEFDSGTSQFDLALTIHTEMFGQAQLSFANDIFDASTGRRLLASYLALLDQVVDAPETRIGEFDLVGAEGRARLQAWNHTSRLLPAPAMPATTVHGLITRQSFRTPADTALRSNSGSLRYAELHQRSNRLARLLRARGVARGALVGLCVERSLDMVVAQLAILKAGAAYVPLDPAYPKDRLAHMCEDAQLALLITESEVSTPHWPHHKCLLLDMDQALVAAQSDADLEANVWFDAGPRDPAYVIYTSGSTGKPKGVVVPHGAAVNFLESMAREPGLEATDVLAAVTTLSFDIAVLELLLPLTVGAQVLLASREEATDGQALRKLLESGQATVMQATPSSWRMLIDAGWQGTPSFKALIGGESLPVDLAEQLLQRCGALWNMYGPTETTVWSTCWRVHSPAQGISIGRPIANTQVHIVDAQGQLCPIGVAGEILIGGDGVALGYLNRPELSAERFITDGFSGKSGARLYRTGDRGRWRHDGWLEHQGRLDYQVKLRGHRIELGEIEANLAKHTQVAQALVVVREDQPGDMRLVAYVVARGLAPDVAALREHLRSTLPDYMLPQHFVLLEALPLLPNGKTNRQALPAPAETAASVTALEAPRTALELAIAEVWQELLGVAQVGLRDNFFDLGGHSLLAMKAVAAIESRHGVKLNARRLVFESLGQLSAVESVPPKSAAKVKPKQRAKAPGRAK